MKGRNLFQRRKVSPSTRHVNRGCRIDVMHITIYLTRKMSIYFRVKDGRTMSSLCYVKVKGVIHDYLQRLANKDFRANDIAMSGMLRTIIKSSFELVDFSFLGTQGSSHEFGLSHQRS